MKKKPVKKRTTLQDLREAKLDPMLQHKMRQKSTMKGIITGTDKMLIRRYARMNLDVARQANNKITMDQLAKNLEKNLAYARPAMRKVMLDQMRKYVKQHS